MNECSVELSAPINPNENPNFLSPRLSNRAPNTKDELHAIYEHEVALINERWVQIGQFQALPKRLFANVNEYVVNKECASERLDDKVIDDIKVLFKRIRRALKVVDRVDAEGGAIKPSYVWLATKARTFLKRLAHDSDLSQSMLGSKRFRKYEKAAKTELALQKSLFKSEVHGLGNDWHVESITSQKKLLDAGRALNVCVQEKSHQTKRYFKHLINQKSVFWLISNEGKPNSLLEVRNAPQRRKQQTNEGLREVREISGLNNDEPEFPLDVARSLVKCLRLDPASCDPLIAAGVFPEFEFGVKDRDMPEAVVNIDQCTYEAWFVPGKIVLRKYLIGKRANAELNEWGYFFAGEGDQARYRDPRFFRCRETERSDGLPEWRALWCEHSASKIDVEELVDVLAQYVCASTKEIRSKDSNRVAP